MLAIAAIAVFAYQAFAGSPRLTNPDTRQRSDALTVSVKKDARTLDIGRSHATETGWIFFGGLGVCSGFVLLYALLENYKTTLTQVLAKHEKASPSVAWGSIRRSRLGASRRKAFWEKLGHPQAALAREELARRILMRAPWWTADQVEDYLTPLDTRAVSQSTAIVRPLRS